MGQIFDRESYTEGKLEERERVIQFIDEAIAKEKGAEDRVTRTYWVLTSLRQKINDDEDP